MIILGLIYSETIIEWIIMQRESAQQQIASVALRGRLIDLKTAEEETRVEEWQTQALEEHIRKAGIRRRGFAMPLAEGVRDITSTAEAINDVKSFLPEVQLSGWELRVERNTRAWGGSYYRVLETTDPDTKEDLRCIQWIYVWTKQRVFISLWMTVLPLFLLSLVGTLIYSYLSLQEAAISVGLIGLIFFLLGVSQLFTAVRGFSKGAFYFSNQQLFLIFGGLFWLLLLEIYLTKGSQNKEIISTQEVWHKIPGQDIIDNLTENLIHKSLSLSWVAALFFILGLAALILWRFQDRIPSFTHATHDMDYAPLFLYLRKRNNSWQLEKARYDAFHYLAETKSYQELEELGAISSNKKSAKLEIPNFWHSFSPLTGRLHGWTVVFLGILILIVSITIGIISFTASEVTFLGHAVFRFVVFPVSMFVGVYLISAKWPHQLVPKKKTNLSDNKFHLTDNRLNIFWNIKGEEPALKVRSKLQDPWMDDEVFTTFRDDLTQIVFYSLLPRLAALEQEKFFGRL